MYNKHEIEWSPDKISKIWNYTNSVNIKRTNYKYFSETLCKVIVNKAKKHILLKGLVLDYGCGGGHLIENLTEQKINCYGVDFSKKSIERLVANSKKFPNSNYFKGAVVIETIPSPSLQSNSYDIVFFIETIEHLFPDEINSTLQEINRILKKDGYVIITTPNNENLNDSKILCPDCGCVFHTVQHMSSWTAKSLAYKLENNGFKKVYCKAILLHPNPLISFLKNTYYAIKNKNKPNLFYIGRKTS